MGADPIAAARALLELRGVAFQWREKDLPRDDTRRALERLGPSSALLVNGDVPLAREISIGVHLPEDGVRVDEARAALGPSALIGRSVHSVDAAREAEHAGADFLCFGPVYDTESKRKYGPPVGLARLAEACAVVSIPVFALGGISLERTEECLAAGAHGVAVIGAVWGAADPLAAARALLARLSG